MLVRMRDFIFDISKIDTITFDHNKFTENSMIFSINQTQHQHTFEDKDEFNKVKEFLTNMCPDITTDEGRSNFLKTIKYVAKLQGFRGDSSEKNNSENPT